MAATVSKYPALMLFSRKRLSPTSCYICVCAALLVYTSVVFWFFAPAEHDIGIDFWEHVAAVKQLMIDPIHPLHPQYATHDPSRQYMPWYLLLANLGRVLSLDPLSVMAIGAILTTLLWVVAIHLFFCEYFESRWAPLVALTCLFFMWGIPWVWSGFYNFRSYLTTAAYPSSFVFGLTLMMWWAAVRAMRVSSLRGWEAPALSVLAGLAVLVHQLSGLFAVVGLLCFLVADVSGQWRRKLILIYFTAMGLAGTVAWPYFNPWEMILKDQVWNPLWAPAGAARFYSPVEVLKCIGPAFPGILAFLTFVRRRVHRAVVMGFLGALFTYVMGGLLGNPMAHRVLILIILCLHIGLIWLLLAFIRGDYQPRTPIRKSLLPLVSLIVAAHVTVVNFEIADIAFPHSLFQRLSIHRHVDVVTTFQTIDKYLSPASVTLAGATLSRVLPAFQGRVVSVYWTSPLVPDDDQRGWDSEHFFSPKTSSTERQNTIARYGVTHILYEVNNVQPGVSAKLHEMADDRVIVDGILLMKIKSMANRSTSVR